MSVQVIGDVLDSTVAPARNRLVLLALANNSNEAGLCRPGIAHLSGATGQSRSTVFRALAELEAEGWLQRRERTRPNGSRTASGYRINRAQLQANRRVKPREERDELEALFDEDPGPIEPPPGHRRDNVSETVDPPCQPDTGGVSDCDGGGVRLTRAGGVTLTPPEPSVEPSGGGARPSRPVVVPDPPPEIPDDEHPPPADAGAAPDARPADRCRRHLGVEDPPACRACQRAREDVERWDRDRSVADRRSASSAARQRAELAVAAIAACGMCDDDGYRGGSLCRHDPDQARRAATGMAAVRAALAQRNAS